MFLNNSNNLSCNVLSLKVIYNKVGVNNFIKKIIVFRGSGSTSDLDSMVCAICQNSVCKSDLRHLFQHTKCAICVQF